MSLLSHRAKAGRTIIKTTQNPQVVAVWASFLHSSGLNIAQQRSADGWILPIPARKACKSIPSSVTEQKEAERNIWPPSSPDSLSQITQHTTLSSLMPGLSWIQLFYTFFLKGLTVTYALLYLL